MIRGSLALAALALSCVAFGGCLASPPAGWTAESYEAPTRFAPGIVSTDEREYGITFTPDGREAYFTRRGRRGPSRIMVTRWSEDGWTEPEPAAFAREQDEAPHVSPDGSMLIFVSRRTMTGSLDRSQNLWIAHRTAEGWAEPEPLPGTVNQPRSEIDEVTTGIETGPVLLPDGVLLYATLASPDWGTDIYVAEPDGQGAWVEPRPLRLNSVGEETNPAISPDGRFLVFEAYRGPDGFGDDDLYVSERTPYGWSDPRLLPAPVNSERSEGHPAFSPDGRHLLFSSNRDTTNGFDDIWIVSVDALGLAAGGT